MRAGLSEDRLIAELLAPLAGEGAFGLRDDCAALALGPDEEMVLTQDALVAGVHFFADDPPAAIAAKALRVNLSDLAAKGAEPAGFLLTWALPETTGEDWLRAFVASLAEDARTYGCPLLGGDTVKTPGPLTLSVTALGRTGRGRMVKRFGAQPGDLLYVSGTIGDSALGLLIHPRVNDSRLAALPAADRAFLLDRYMRPRPRNALAGAMRLHANGGMDVSDGLAGDLAKMMRASGTRVEVDMDSIPMSSSVEAAVRKIPELLDIVLSGGDDYEILAAVPPSSSLIFEETCRMAGVPVARIGTVLPAQGHPGADFRDGGDQIRQLTRPSFSHF